MKKGKSCGGMRKTKTMKPKGKKKGK